jgi:peptidoglycan/xylan/chitin deacetylase (PgdA/CDA1 family)
MIGLLYHDIVDEAQADLSGFPGAAANHYKLSPTTFALHLRAAAASVAPVLFTFDDGGVSALAPCADLLDEAGVCGLFFVPTDYIGRPGFCTGAQLRQLHDRGHIIGSHSASHPMPISGLSHEALREEWERSRRVLQDVIGCDVADASVPGGFNSTRVERAAQNAGYRRLFNSQPTQSVRVVGGMAVHGRFSITRSTRLSVIEQVHNGSRLPWIRQSLLWEAKSVAKKIGGDRWLKFRSAYFARRQHP